MLKYLKFLCLIVFLFECIPYFTVWQQDVILEKSEKVEGSTINMLEIPSISLQKIFYEKEEEANALENGLFVLKESVFPKEGVISEIFIASHSGSSAISYFKNLHKIKVGDHIFLTYHGIVYCYEVLSIEEQKKQGFLEISEKEYNALYLITCTKNKKDKQTIVIAKQTNL